MAQTASPADITAVSNILKKVYTSDAIESQLYEDVPLYSALTKTTEYHDAVGDQAIGFIKTGRNANVSSRSLNGGTLGAADHQKTQKWAVDYTATYIQVKILGTTIAKMSTARQAAVRAIDLEVNGGLTDIKKDLQRQFYSAGDSKIAVAGTTSASTTLNLQQDTTANAQAANDAIIRGWLQPGRYLDIGTLASPTSQTSDNKITAVAQSDSAPSITVTSAVTTTTGTHFLFAAGNAAASSVSYESNGLGNLVNDTGSFAGIDPATEPTWKAQVVTSSGSLSRADMQKVWRQIRQYGGDSDTIWTSLEHADDYLNLLQSQVRFTSEAQLAAGNAGGDSKPAAQSYPLFNNIPVKADPDCPRQVMYFLDMDEIFLVSAGDVTWQNVTTGGDVLAWVQGEDSYVARAASYLNLVTNHRRAQGRIKNITVN